LTNLKWSEPGTSADESELRELARANIAHFKAPHSVTFLKELPKTSTGKIQKYIFERSIDCYRSAVAFASRQSRP